MARRDRQPAYVSAYVQAYVILVAGAVLEILLSSFQTAYLSRTFAVCVPAVGWSPHRVSSDSDAATQIFDKVSNFPSWRPKKKGLHYISLTLKASNTPAVYASWNVVAEKGAHPSSRENVLSGFWKPQKSGQKSL